MNANQYSYFMGGFMFFTIWMLIISYRGVPKVYLMRSIQVSTNLLSYLHFQQSAFVVYIWPSRLHSAATTNELPLTCFCLVCLICLQESVFMLNCKLQAVFQVALQGNVSTHPPLNPYTYTDLPPLNPYTTLIELFRSHPTMKHTVAHRSYYVAIYGPQVKFVTTKKDLVKVSPIRQDIGTSYWPH
jgi:hypothetical protein